MERFSDVAHCSGLGSRSNYINGEWILTSDLLTLWIVVCQAPLSMEISGQEYWSGWLFPSQLGGETIKKMTCNSSGEISSWLNFELIKSEYNISVFNYKPFKCFYLTFKRMISEVCMICIYRWNQEKICLHLFNHHSLNFVHYDRICHAHSLFSRLHKFLPCFSVFSLFFFLTLTHQVTVF